MSSSAKRIRTLAREQLDRRLAQIRTLLPVLRAPEQGWIATLRTGLGMTQTQLADRMGVTQQHISKLEKREADGSVTLTALEQAARALGGELVYAIVPERPLRETLEQRALQIARRMTGSVSHTMRLEDQETGTDTEERTKDLARELLESPERLWSAPDAG